MNNRDQPRSPSPKDPKDARTGSVIGTAMTVLRCFDGGNRLLGVVEIAERTGLHKSSISRLMGTLEHEQLVERDPASRKYRLGLGLLSVAGTLLADLDVRRAAFPVLRNLAEETGESCSLMVWARDESVCVEQIPSNQSIKHTTPIGTSYRTTASSSVKIFLAYLPDHVVSGLVGAGGSVVLEGHRSAKDLRSELDVVAAEGVARNDGQTDPGEVGVSAVVRDHRGEAVAAVLISAPRFRVDHNQLQELTSKCRDAACQVTVSLGGNTTHTAG